MMTSGFCRKLHLMVLVLTSLLVFGEAQSPAKSPSRCFATENYTANSAYSDNLNITLISLSTNITQYGFYNVSSGQGTNRANAIALCRGDETQENCRACVRKATVELLQECPNQKQAITWHDMCMLHYSNLPISGVEEDGATIRLRNTNVVMDTVQFQKDRIELLDALRMQATNGSMFLKVGAGFKNGSTSDYNVLYAFLQCVPTMSSGDCNTCLNQVIQNMRTNAEGARQLTPSCTLRYEIYPFYNETRLREVGVQLLQLPNFQPPGTNEENAGENGDSDATKTVILIVVPTVVCIVLVVCVTVLLRRRRMKKRLQPVQGSTEEISSAESLQYDFGQIRDATDGFSDANKLGQGGFGVVYRGNLSNGEEIAVKRLSRELGQGDVEFKNEVVLVARLQHRNLVRLLGFSLEGRERLLIYEFVPNASLDQFIFDSIKSSQLNWERRYKIISGIARGVLYLHEDSRLRIIHRDLKASNILLDEKMNPKIADFGLARLFEQDETQRNTSRIAGTYGYMPPEYALYGRFSIKSDVFSFGVLVLEVISGQRIISSNYSEHDLLSLVWTDWCKGATAAVNVVDPMLKDEQGSIHDILRCIHIGLLCVQENPEERPTMSSVVTMLSSSTITLQVPSQPAYVATFQDFGSEKNLSSSKPLVSIKQNKSEASSQNEMSVLYPR